MPPEFFSSLLISSRLISVFLNFSQFILTLLSSPQLLSAHLVPSHLFCPPPISSKLFSHLLSWSQIWSARLTSSQLFSAHSQTISPFLSPKTCSKNGSRRQSKQPLHFHIEDFTQRIFTHSKFLHREAWTHRSFYTELGKFSSRRSYHTQQIFRQRICYTQKFLHTANFHTEKFFYTRQAFTHRSFYTQPAFTQRNFFTEEQQ